MVPRLAGALALVSIGAGAWVIGRVVGTGAAFYCEPLVPWRIEIALFGSFVGGYLTVMAHAPPGRSSLMLLALLWIAPFYGFFSAPVFLGVSLNTLCPNRPLPTVLLTALSMLVGEGVGSAVADWMSGRSTAPQQRRSLTHAPCARAPRGSATGAPGVRCSAAQAAAPGRGQRLRRCGASASVQPRGARHWDALLSTVSAYTVLPDHA